MDQRKTGNFLKTLRKEKGLTQEQLAEQFNVSDRTVSRWETGSNMPDLSILIEIADFYDVDIREIIDGERKSENMDSETKNTLKKVAEYSDAEKKILKKRVISMTAGTLIIFLFSILLDVTEGFGFIPETPCENMIDFALGLALGSLVLNMLYLNGTLDKIRAWKLKHFHTRKEIQINK
ncbi:MAG: helix-turn-helix transcriptional regulator [Lachnospiraceae bacterium]|nr:helix-turn-helix transcriptional regulator [Lachnospiraceae bacterium]